MVKHRENNGSSNSLDSSGKQTGEKSPLLSAPYFSKPSADGAAATINESSNPLINHSVNAASPVDEEDMKFPISTFMIISSEFCERFSFYGMKTVLYFYLERYLRFDADRSTTILHIFIMFAYFCSLLGGILSDSYLGKFKTILYLSLVYSIGNIVLSVTAIPGVTGSPPHWWGVSAGLFLLAVGTGGIKPCVSAFGGDQFHPSQTRAIQMFFSVFYFSINLGSVLSTLITPELRSLTCFGGDCYSLAFGVPAILMLVATLIFVSGWKLYKITPPGGNILVKVSKVVFYAIGKREINQSTAPTAHWLDYAIPKYGRALVDDTKTLFGVLFMFIPLPFFWALFDQQSSRWVAQASLMNLDVSLFGLKFTIKPDQMQSINAILILAMIPFFEKIVYPLVKKSGLSFLPLRRMGTGMFLAGISFLVAAALQVSIDGSHIEDIVDGDHIVKKCVSNCVSIGWQMPQYVILTAGEILLSITGIEFAYSQAPESMKSVCQASWLITVAIGNLIVAVIAESSLFRQSVEFVFFAFLIFAATFAFGIMARMYKYIEPPSKHRDEESDILIPGTGDEEADGLL